MDRQQPKLWSPPDSQLLLITKLKLSSLPSVERWGVSLDLFYCPWYTVDSSPHLPHWGRHPDRLHRRRYHHHPSHSLDLSKPSTVYCGRFPLLTARGISRVVSSRYRLGIVLAVSLLGDADHGSSPLPGVEHCGVSLYLLLPPRLPRWGRCPSRLHRQRRSSLFPTHSPISLRTALGLLWTVSLPLCSWYIAGSAL